AFLLATGRSDGQLIPVLLDEAGETGDFGLAKKQQVFGLAIILELEPGRRQRSFDLAFGFQRIASGQTLQQQRLELLGAYAAMLRGDQLMLPGGQTNGALEALAADPRPAMAAEQGILGGTGVVAVEVGWRKVLDQMKFDEQTHDVPLSRWQLVRGDGRQALPVRDRSPAPSAGGCYRDARHQSVG